MHMCHTLHMPASTKPQKSSERVVVLLRPSERKRLRQLARAESVSAAEILRRSLAAYAPESEQEERKLIAELNAAIDRNLAVIAESQKKIDESLASIEKQRLPDEINARLDELYKAALAQQASKKHASVPSHRSQAA